MKNVLALDLGRKKTGVALAKQGVIFERPKIEFSHLHQLFAAVKKICREEEIAEIVVGIPFSEKFPHQARENQKIARQLQKETGVPVKLVNEQFTSTEAQRQLQNQGFSTEEVQRREDSYAARLILQEYLKK